MLLGTIRRFSEVFVVSDFFSTPTPPPFSPTSHPGLTVFLSKMSSFLIQNRFSATLSPRCNPRAADLRILLRITLKYLKIVSKICNSPKNIEAGFSRERPPARPHNGPNGPGPKTEVSGEQPATPSECTGAARPLDFTPTKRGVPFGAARRVATGAHGIRLRGVWGRWGRCGAVP